MFLQIPNKKSGNSLKKPPEKPKAASVKKEKPVSKDSGRQLHKTHNTCWSVGCVALEKKVQINDHHNHQTVFVP